jgi:hypothetical protein
MTGQRKDPGERVEDLVLTVGGYVRQDHVHVGGAQRVAGGGDDRAVQGVAVWRHR